MYLDAKQQDRPTAGDLAISSARQSLQELLFDGLDHRISFDLGLPRKVFFYGDVSGIGADLWGWAVHQGAELLLRDGKGVDCAWIAANARAFDCMIVHAEYLDDLEDTVDFCMNVRQAVPGLPILLVSTEVRDSDLSSARMMACDATVKWPAGSQAMAQGLRATVENHKRFLAARYGIGCQTAY